MTALPANLAILDSPDQAEAVLHPIRRRILGSLTEPDSATGLSRKLGLTRQKINYHLRELESRGLVELVEQRTRRNCIERIVQATARAYVINPAVLGDLGEAGSAADARDRFSSTYLIATAWRLLRDVLTLRRRSGDTKKHLATLTAAIDVRFASAKDQNAFAEELLRVLASLSTTYHDERATRGRLFRFIIAGHPAITKSEADHCAEVGLDPPDITNPTRETDKGSAP